MIIRCIPMSKWCFPIIFAAFSFPLNGQNGLDTLGAFIQAPTTEGPERFMALLHLSESWILRNLDSAQYFVDQLYVESQGHPHFHGLALLQRAQINRLEQRLDQAFLDAEEGLALFKEKGDLAGTAQALEVLGNLYWDRGEEQDSRIFLRESIAIKEELGDQKGVASTLISMGLQHIQQN
ncbi:MAG: tetratricopeptide repeat protein, partial [Bacteroidota bacterium]